MKKRIKIILIAFLTFILFSPSTFAASFGIYSNVSSTTVGQTIKISVTANEVVGRFKVSSSDDSVLVIKDKDEEWIENDTKTFSFKAVGTGTATVTVTIYEGSTMDDVPPKPFEGSKTVTVKVVSSNNSSSNNNSSSGSTSEKKIYSGDNTLSILNVEGYDIEPNFDKDTLEYKLEVDESIEKINISAKANDDKAEISGIGEINLSSGENIIEVKVTAENGNEKIYKVKVNVVDKNPIEVSIGKNKYTVVKKNNDLIEKLQKFEESTIKIKDQDVVCYNNETSKLTLVILKDKNSKYAYYIYNSKKDTYTLYRQIDIGNISLFYKDMPKKSIPLGTKKYNFTYNNEKFIGYKYNKDSEFYMFYAMNIDTGKYSIYVYDTKENTIQRYNKDEEDKNNNILMKYKILSYVTIGIVLITCLIIIFIMNKKRNRR